MSERETEREAARWLVADPCAWRASVARSIEIAQETLRATREAIARSQHLLTQLDRRLKGADGVERPENQETR
jgi:hypothetical protein